jgi:outer membrane protein assembly factor BamB
VRWRYHFPQGTLQVAQPALSGGTVYITATTISLNADGQPKGEPVGAIYALRASDGMLLWHFQTTGEDTAPVTVFNGIVYAETSIDPTGTANGAIYALRAGDGSLLWRRQTNGDALGLPAASNGGIYLVTRLVLNNSGIVTALRPRDGSVLWQESIGPSLSSGATLADGVLYIGGSEAVYAVNSGNGQILWQHPVASQIDLSPVVQDGSLYLQSLEDSSVEALNRQDGSLRWRVRIQAEENIASLIATPTTLYVPLSRVIVAISAGDGSVLTRYPTDETNSGVAVAGNLLLVGVAGSLDARQIGTSSLVWHVSLPDYSTVPPVVGN